MQQRQSGDLGQPVVSVLAQGDLRVGPADRSGNRERVRQAAAVGHQVVDGDRALRRHGAVQRAGGVDQHPHIGELGQPPGDGVGERELALLDERHRRRDGDRLGHRGDPEDGVAAHRQLRADVAVADLVELQHFSAMPDTRDRSGEQTGLDRLVDGGSVIGEAHRGESTDWAVVGRVLGCGSSTSFNDPSGEAEKEVWFHHDQH